MNKFFDFIFKKEVIGPVIIVAVGFLLHKVIKIIVEKIFIHEYLWTEEKKNNC